MVQSGGEVVMAMVRYVLGLVLAEDEFRARCMVERYCPEYHAPM